MYKSFAKVYDALIETDYKKWVDYYEQIFEKFGSSPKTILDLGCGTGNIMKILFERGHDCIGVDNSVEMLLIAREKMPDALLLNQDMANFELYGTVDAIVSALDCVNYLNSPEKLLKCLKLVKNYLEYDGIVVFDINSEHKLKNVLGNNTFVYDEENYFYTWTNELDGDFCNFSLNIFEKLKDGRYARVCEEQTQRIFATEEVKSLIEKSGLEFLGVFKEFTFDTPTEEMERIFFVAKRGKE